MGTYTDLCVSGYPILETKSEVVPEIMTIFKETDRRVFTRRVSERNVIVWGVPEEPDDDELETAIEYSCETPHIVDRLNVMGFTLNRVRKAFESGRHAKLEELESWAEEHPDLFAEELNLVKDLCFDSYVSGFRTVIAERLRRYPFDDGHEQNPTIKYILKDHEEYLFGFFGRDLRLLLRLACDLAPCESRVVQDITQLVHAGYYGESEPVCDIVTQALITDHPANSPRIVLTEGSTDAKILRESLALLYPHLAAYYSFLDFESSRLPGGAGYLVSVVKAFAGAGITNRIVAIFDNDTAARDAVRMLDSVFLPRNIKVLHYPELDLLRNYPTLGPGGVASLNINGLAGSIELYLGSELLHGSHDELIPVQWKGYFAKLGQYQGEVLNKSSILEAFDKKLASCKNNPMAFQEADWVGLRKILEAIFCAFD